MLSIFFLVAVFNLILGYVLGSLYPSRPMLNIPCLRRFRRTRSADTAPPPESSPVDTFPSDSHEPEQASQQGNPPLAPSLSCDATDSAQASAPSSGQEPLAATAAPETIEKAEGNAAEVPERKAGSANLIECGWDAFSSELQKVTDRINYVRSINDKGLAQQTADSLTELVSAWYSETSAALEADGAEEALTDDELMQLELLVAQLETTIANLKCIDWTADLDAIIERLEKEVRTIEGLRPASEGVSV